MYLHDATSNKGYKKESGGTHIGFKQISRTGVNRYAIGECVMWLDTITFILKIMQTILYDRVTKRQAIGKYSYHISQLKSRGLSNCISIKLHYTTGKNS